MAVTARVHITEYAFLASEHFGNGVQAGSEPGITQQVVSIGAASAASSALNDATRFIRIDTDTACYVEIGGTAPTAAAATSKYLPAGASEYFGVQKGKSHKVACIQVPA